VHDLQNSLLVRFEALACRGLLLQHPLERVLALFEQRLVEV
jgi:hypothetical protein